jgi:hypothetical protein
MNCQGQSGQGTCQDGKIKQGSKEHLPIARPERYSKGVRESLRWQSKVSEGGTLTFIFAFFGFDPMTQWDDGGGEGREGK